MIVFNTIKKAEHYVRYCQKNKDYSEDGYIWSEKKTYIIGDKVICRTSGDSCGCGCDMYRYDYSTIIGRIKDKRTHALSIILS